MIPEPDQPLIERLYILDLEQKYQQLIDEFLPIIDQEDHGALAVMSWSECFRIVGRAYRMTRRFDLARTLYQKAVTQFDSKFHRLSLAMTCLDLGDYPAALALLNALIAAEPDFAYGYFLRGKAELALKQPHAAAHSFDVAGNLEPDQEDLLLARLNLAREQCDWAKFGPLFEQAQHRAARAGASCSLTLLETIACPLDRDAHADQKRLSEARSAQLLQHIDRSAMYNNHSNARAHTGRLRIGYVSANFARHPGAMLMRGVFEHHDRDAVEIFGYALTPDDGSRYRRDAEQHIEHFRDLSQLGSSEAARIIHDDGIQILIDMKGWTENNRQDILALRPAPVQISYLGYAAPMIAPWIDYQIVDPILVPSDFLAEYGPPVIIMPDCYQPNDRARPVPTGTLQRSDVGLPMDAVILSCFNSPYKMTAEWFGMWMEILRQRPQAILWVLVTDDVIAKNLRQSARQHGIDPNRIIIAPALALAEHIDRLSLADIALDTFPYGGHTTTSEALWAGVPVVTMAGQSFATRVASSLLHACGLEMLVTETPTDYIDRVLMLIDQPAYRAALHAHLHDNRLQLPLFDTAHKARALEIASQAAWQHYLSGDPIQHIQIV